MRERETEVRLYMCMWKMEEIITHRGKFGAEAAEWQNKTTWIYLQMECQSNGGVGEVQWQASTSAVKEGLEMLFVMHAVQG